MKLERIVLCTVIPFIFGINGCRKDDVSLSSYTSKEILENEQFKKEQLRRTILSYLSQPQFSNSDFLEQISHTKARFEMLDLVERKVYLSIPRSRYDKRTLDELTINPKAVEFGNVSGPSRNLVQLGDYQLHRMGSLFLRFPINDFKVDSFDIISIPFRAGSYDVTMPELVGFMENRSVYGGQLAAKIGINQYGESKVIANHGAFVAQKGETSLTKLVKKIIGNKLSTEKTAQKLLNFVSSELSYNDDEAYGQEEVLKRPNEVLMTRGSDCSGLAILYSSLLEQTDVDYRLVYLKGHISVAVEGKYDFQNGLHFQIGGKVYSIAETTTPGFQIGKTNVPLKVDDIKYLQRPGSDALITSFRTGEPLRFM